MQYHFITLYNIKTCCLSIVKSFVLSMISSLIFRSSHISQSNINSDSQNCYNISTRTIKISYGPQGEGTVLKIPAQIDNVNDDSEENVNNEEQNNKPIDDKAARR